MYSEMLRLTFESDEPGSDQTIGRYVSQAMTYRARLARRAAGAGRLEGSGGRVGDELAYDAALVRLCKQLGVAHDFLGGWPGPKTPVAVAEARLAERLPSTVAALAGPAIQGEVSES